ncbi:hypothetical protein ACJX0J_017327, partial [Zea mays]
YWVLITVEAVNLFPYLLRSLGNMTDLQLNYQRRFKMVFYLCLLIGRIYNIFFVNCSVGHIS